MRRRREDEDGPPPPGMRIVCVGGNEFEIPDDGRPFTLQAAQLRGANPLKRAAPRADDVFDATDSRPLKQAAGPRADPRSLTRQTADIRATRGASARPSSVEEAEARRADLSANGRELESQSRALQTHANYGTATTWWARFTAFILFPVQILVFDKDCAEARAAVCDLCRQFLTFTHRCIGQRFRKQDPADPNSSSRYWSQIVTLHRELPTSIDLSFTKSTASRWLAGAQRVRVETFGARPKKKKAMFSIQHIRDLYDAPWTSAGGERNPTRRRLVLRAAPQLAIQVLFRASEYLRGREGFNHTVHLSRAHATYYTWDWQEIPTEELTPSRLRALLSSGRARALIRMPRLKNDQYLTREFPPTALELNTGPICALRHLLLMEIDDPITTESGRQQAPMFVDPDTGLGLTKIALASALNTLTYAILTTKYGRQITMAEIRKQWSLHSFRITGQNLLREAGAQEWQIRQAGRWLSDCALRYDRANIEGLSSLSNAMSSLTAPPVTHLTVPGMPTYPYPIQTLHPSLSEHPEAEELDGAGVFTLSAESQSRQYFRESSHKEAQTAPEVERYRKHITIRG